MQWLFPADGDFGFLSAIPYAVHPSEQRAEDINKLNMLKDATDFKGIRTFAWNAEIPMETENGKDLLRKFVFEGNVIFITNIDMFATGEKDNGYPLHFEALVSRLHYSNLGITSNRDSIVRIRQVCRNGMLRDMGISAEAEQIVLDYVEEHQDSLKELSLWMVLKMATLIQVFPEEWRTLAGAIYIKEK